MLENEGTELESTESGVEEGSSTEAPESSSEGAAQAAPKQQQDTTPFHEHPRFKELVEQKNESLKRYQDMESRYKAIEQQLSSFRDSQPKAPTETDQLIADLKKVDPRLANVIEAQLKASETSKTVQARLDAFERQSQEASRQNVLMTAVGKINSLHESNKMSDFGKQFINSQLDIAYRNGSLNAADIKAVEAAYNQASTAIKKAFEEAKRTERESYVQDKKKDSSVPTSQPKGAPAKPAAKKTQFSKDPETARAQVVQKYLKQAAANRDADAV